MSHQKFFINDSDSFAPSSFPQLQASLEELVLQLAKEPAGAAAEMILSFVQYHRIDPQYVLDNPALARSISSGSLSIQVMEDMFESSWENPLFKKELEQYIRTYFINRRSLHLPITESGS